MIGVLPVSTISFCSGCTVLAMSVVSLIRNRSDGIRLEVKTSTLLAVGAVMGGFVGKFLFELVRNVFENENMLGAIQAVCLTVITFGVFLYVCNKDKLPSKKIGNVMVTALIGIFLGIISSFLGIGGGTSNVAVLFFFFSMDAKQQPEIHCISSFSHRLQVSDLPYFQLQCLILSLYICYQWSWEASVERLPVQHFLKGWIIEVWRKF